MNEKVSFIGSSIQSTASHYGGNSRLSEKPILRMLEGQYLYVVKNDIFEAKKTYQEGIILA